MPPPRGLVQQFDQFLHRSQLLMPGQRLLIACSGGADSMALLRLLDAVNQSKHWQWKLNIAHINHGLRGRQSLADQHFVQKIAKILKLPCYIKKVQLKKIAGRHVSEATARQARWDALSLIARRHRCQVIVLAHHADDQAETVLLRILRGCSIAGLGAMRPRRRMGPIHLIRPLLTFDRAALQTYLRTIGQTWRDDHTNALPLYLRNQIRHQLLPQLEKYQPAIRRLLVRLASQSQESTRAHQYSTRALARRALALTRTSATFIRARLRRQPRLIVGMLLRSAVQHLGGNVDQVAAIAVARAIDALRHQSSGQQIELGGGLILHVQRDSAVLRRTKAKKRRTPKP